MSEETREAFGHTWTRKANRSASEQAIAMQWATDAGYWTREERTLDLYTEVTIYRDVQHAREPYLAAWMIVPDDPCPWWCARFAPEEVAA